MECFWFMCVLLNCRDVWKLCDGSGWKSTYKIAKPDIYQEIVMSQRKITKEQKSELLSYLRTQGKHLEHSKMLAAKWVKNGRR